MTEQKKQQGRVMEYQDRNGNWYYGILPEGKDYEVFVSICKRETLTALMKKFPYQDLKLDLMTGKLVTVNKCNYDALTTNCFHLLYHKEEDAILAEEARKEEAIKQQMAIIEEEKRKTAMAAQNPYAASPEALAQQIVMNPEEEKTAASQEGFTVPISNMIEEEVQPFIEPTLEGGYNQTREKEEPRNIEPQISKTVMSKSEENEGYYVDPERKVTESVVDTNNSQLKGYHPAQGSTYMGGYPAYGNYWYNNPQYQYQQMPYVAPNMGGAIYSSVYNNAYQNNHNFSSSFIPKYREGVRL